MTETPTLREVLTPACPLGTADDLILEWVQDGTLFRVKRAGDYYLDIAPQLVNYRLVTTPVDNEMGWERGWCYVGKDRDAWMAVLLAAALWEGSDDSEPLGWNKNLQTQAWREPGTSQTWQTSSAVARYAGMPIKDEAGPGCE